MLCFYIIKERGVTYMDLLEVQSISKTYGSGEATVHALKNVSFLYQRENMWQLSENPGLARVHSLI